MAKRSVENVRSLERGLRLLQAMNKDPSASVSMLARVVGIPRSTVYRLLETLSSIGFVFHSSGGGFRLARYVRTLSDGFVDEEWIEAAWREMIHLTGKVIWPVSLLVREEAVMVIRRTTHERSPLSIDYGMSGRYLPITESSGGIAYLAFCPEEERRNVLAMPAAYAENRVPANLTMVEERLQFARDNGYATRAGGLNAKTGSLSVPIFGQDRVLGSLALIFILAGMKMEDAIAKLEQPMKAAADAIGAGFVRLPD